MSTTQNEGTSNVATGVSTARIIEEQKQLHAAVRGAKRFIEGGTIAHVMKTAAASKMKKPMTKSQVFNLLDSLMNEAAKVAAEREAKIAAFKKGKR